jgi:hypothetical protein
MLPERGAGTTGSVTEGDETWANAIQALNSRPIPTSIPGCNLGIKQAFLTALQVPLWAKLPAGQHTLGMLT